MTKEVEKKALTNALEPRLSTAELHSMNSGFIIESLSDGAKVLAKNHDSHQAYHQYVTCGSIKIAARELAKRIAEGDKNPKLMEAVVNMNDNRDFLIWGSSDEDFPKTLWGARNMFTKPPEPTSVIHRLQHLYDVHNSKDPYSKGLLFFGSAVQRTVRLYNLALEQYQKHDYQRAFHNLGRAIHLVGGDFNVPSHVHCDPHGDDWLKQQLVGRDGYESEATFKHGIYSVSGRRILKTDAKKSKLKAFVQGVEEQEEGVGEDPYEKSLVARHASPNIGEGLHPYNFPKELALRDVLREIALATAVFPSHRVDGKWFDASPTIEHLHEIKYPRKQLMMPYPIDASYYQAGEKTPDKIEEMARLLVPHGMKAAAHLITRFIKTVSKRDFQPEEL